MGISTAAYVALGIGAAGTGYSIYQGQQTQKAAKDASNQAQAAANTQVQQQKQQQTNVQNQTAANTASAQARVRALQNPDSSGNTVMTPFSGNIAPSSQASPGTLSTTGKQTVGS